MFSQGPGGAAYDSTFSTSDPKLIKFESGNASIGTGVTSVSSSSVDITIKNGGSASVNPVLQSQITAAGLGFYLAKTGGPCGGSGIFPGGDGFGGCGQTTGPLTFSDLPRGPRQGDLLATAAFEFSVTADGTSVYDFRGVETLTEGDGFPIVDALIMTLNGAPVAGGVLQNLTHNTPGSPGSADGYMWDASNVNIALGSALAAGATRDVVYTATVTTLSVEGCTAADPTVCLVPYAAFGDPIGKGGGITNARRFGSGLDGGPVADPATGISFVDNWGPQRFATPTFDNGILSFNSVPEPGTWAMLILGSGLVGAALRRRRVLSYT